MKQGLPPRSCRTAAFSPDGGLIAYMSAEENFQDIEVYLSRDPERVARIEREAKLLALLHTLGIAAIRGLDDANGRLFPL